MKIIHIEGSGQFVTVTKYPDPDVTLSGAYWEISGEY